MKLTGRIDWMVYALLRLAKLDAGTVQLQQIPYQIEDLIKAAVTPLEIALDIRDITLEVQVQPDLQHRGDISWDDRGCQQYFEKLHGTYTVRWTYPYCNERQSALSFDKDHRQRKWLYQTGSSAHF